MIKLGTLFLVAGVVCSPYGERDRYNNRDYAVDDQPYIPRTVSHTFPNNTQCRELCELPCSSTNVYMGSQVIEMFNCAKMKPPKTTMLGSIKGNSFYMTLLVLACITAVVISILCFCFCCSYCCRQGVSSRGSSKDALTQDDGFRESLYEANIQKERVLDAPLFSSRRQQRTTTAQVV